MTVLILILIALTLLAVGVLSVGLKEDTAPATGIGGPAQPNTDVDVK